MKVLKSLITLVVLLVAATQINAQEIDSQLLEISIVVELQFTTAESE
jgi:hypothetical protein